MRDSIHTHTSYWNTMWRQQYVAGHERVKKYVIRNQKANEKKINKRRTEKWHNRKAFEVRKEKITRSYWLSWKKHLMQFSNNIFMVYFQFLFSIFIFHSVGYCFVGVLVCQHIHLPFSITIYIPCSIDTIIRLCVYAFEYVSHGHTTKVTHITTVRECDQYNSISQHHILNCMECGIFWSSISNH